MTDSSDNDVGYSRPPKSKRWKKGESGNPRNKAKARATESPLAVIERLLLKPVDIKKDGHPTKMPTLEAITYRLLQQSFKGNKKADRVLQQYQKFAERNSTLQFEIVFVDNEYTNAFAVSREGDDV